MSSKKNAAQPQQDRIEVPNTLAGALLVAQSSIDGVGKDARNSFHKYAYTSAEGMISACREALHGAGLTLQRSGWSLSQDGMTVSSMFILRHASSGQQESYEVPWLVVVEKGKPIDKALAGALTTSLGYLLRDLLLLPREDEDGSMDRRNDDPRSAQPSVGFKPQAPRAGAVAELNAKLAAQPPKPPAAPPAPEEADGVLRRVSSREHGGRTFQIGHFERDDGSALDFVIGAELTASAMKCADDRCRARWQPRDGKTAILMSIEPLDGGPSEEGSNEEALPF